MTKNEMVSFDQDVFTVHHKPEGQHELVQVRVQRTLGEPSVHSFSMLAEEAEALAQRLQYVAAIARLHRTTRGSR